MHVMHHISLESYYRFTVATKMGSLGSASGLNLPIVVGSAVLPQVVSPAFILKSWQEFTGQLVASQLVKNISHPDGFISVYYEAVGWWFNFVC